MVEGEDLCVRHACLLWLSPRRCLWLWGQVPHSPVRSRGMGRALRSMGGGKWGTGLHSRSFCAYSGQNDHVQGQDFTNAQNWGQDLKLVRQGLLSEPE